MFISNPAKDKKIGIAIMAKLNPSVPREQLGLNDEDREPLRACAEDLMKAIEAKSTDGIVDALKVFLELHDMHEESESPEQETLEHE